MSRRIWALHFGTGTGTALPETVGMAPDVAEIERALLALAPEKRAAVIHAGLLSLDGDNGGVSQDAIDAAWRDEVGSRFDDVLPGRVKLGSFEATRAKFAARYPASAP